MSNLHLYSKIYFYIKSSICPIIYTCVALFLPWLSNAQEALHNVIITEIMADPTPSYGLPEIEYLEIYNNTNSTINLSGYTLYYSTSSVIFPNYEIAPEEYAIVCRRGNAEAFKSYGKVLELERLSLLNTGTTLKLFTKNAELAHQVSYNERWYSPNKDQGFSLEMIDLNYPCTGAGNWASSAAEIGGSPGQINASNKANPDLDPPKLLNISLINTKNILLTFSENLLTNKSVLELAGEFINKDSVYFIDNTQLKIGLTAAIDTNKFYDYIINGIADCSGNVADEITFTIGNTLPPNLGDVLISEILFNPKTGADDFVELINASSSIQNLRNLYLANMDEFGKPTNKKLIIKSDYLLEPGQIVCLTTNKNTLADLYKVSNQETLLEIGSLPSFNNDKGSVVLLSNSETIIDSMRYSESMHYPTIDIMDGVSLEKKNLALQNNVLENWQSVSSQYEFATPGFRPDYGSTNELVKITIDKPIISPGELAQISIENLDGPAQGTFELFNINGLKVNTLLNNVYLNSSFSYTYDGTDNSGKTLPTGPYLLKATVIQEQNVIYLIEKIVIGFHE